MSRFFSLLSSLLIIILCFSACRDDDQVGVEIPLEATDYFPLREGAYWVYDTYFEQEEMDSTLIVFGTRDTLRVTERMVERGRTVFQLEKTDGFPFKGLFPTAYQVRDGNIYANDTTLILTVDQAQANSVVYEVMLEPDLGRMEYTLQLEPTSVEVPAGQFDCIDFQGQILATDETRPIHQKIAHRYYTKGVGLVLANEFFFNNARKIEMRLVDYFLP